FDMGGTSTDVSRFAGEYELIHESETAGIRIQAPQIEIRTVAAGGGSRLFYRNSMFEVGPQSAGAHPGPICYRKNGHLTVTDANLFLGRLHPDYFPAIFGPNEDQALGVEQAYEAIINLTEKINRDLETTGKKLLSPQEVAFGFLEVANEVMVRPIREISVMRGYNIREHVLACFGGAGGQHGCAIAAKLGISKIFIHRYSGILSAVGMALADVSDDRREPAGSQILTQIRTDVLARLEKLAQQSYQNLLDQDYHNDCIVVEKFLNLRYQGTDNSHMIKVPQDDDFQRAFKETHLQRYGFDLEDRELLVDDIRVRATASAKIPITVNKSGPFSSEPEKETPCYFKDGWQKTPIFQFDRLQPELTIAGPALIIMDGATILVEPDCTAEIVDTGLIIHVQARKEQKNQTECDPIQLAIFSNQFMSIAEQMGRILQKTAISTNIKERLDFSCAIFDSSGGLVANAPHVPVHLGAMSEAVRRQIEVRGHELKPGEVIGSNHPSMGGSHLPDITVITPVWKENRIRFFVACRGHHSDIGSISPGSMPPFSKSLDEEGLHLKSFNLMYNDRFQEEELRKRMAAIRPQVRHPDSVISDLKAQIAANHQGTLLLTELIESYDEETVLAYMVHIQNNAESAVRTMLRKIGKRNYKDNEKTIFFAEDFLDDGSAIRLRLEIDPREGTALFDFTGSGKELPGNLNAPVAVTQSAILYALRCLIDQEIPLNQGCLNPISLILPPGSLLNPSDRAAVAGGNVLTSQRIVDVILKAFQAAAASQGCMNNLTFGNDKFGYYETICGGSGAGPSFSGCSGVHTHMTNTRITDPEILEQRYPVMLKQFSLRSNSGGKGHFNGGDGVIREVEFLEDLHIAILSERRVYSPYGMQGGEPAARGKNLLITKEGRSIDLGGKYETNARHGDSIRILTPGGGGWGKKD
ncbi:MAG: hydantoinase B/oxoprolinase family protein, partial [Desulfobulbaceae bacterium]|nr:hydantoinase B/oxoprolinase family protein [Desulfobulbaceae bacterium]